MRINASKQFSLRTTYYVNVQCNLHKNKVRWRKCYYYRFSEWQQHLPAEHVAVVSRSGAVNDDPVTLVELLHFKISAELLHDNKQKGCKYINGEPSDSAFWESPLSELLLITANWTLSLKLALKRSRQAHPINKAAVEWQQEDTEWRKLPRGSYGEVIRIIVAHLQEAFGSSRWMFWALSAGQNRRVERMSGEGSSSQIQTRIQCQTVSKQIPRRCRVPGFLSPCPPSRVAAAGRCHCCAPTWPGLSWWTGLWCTGLCCESLQTALPRGRERLDWPWQTPAQSLKSQLWSRRVSKWMWCACLFAARPSHLARHTLTGSCCRPCTELGWTTGGSWEHRYVCPPPGHEERDDGDC